mgnify:CR=1 FL=1
MTPDEMDTYKTLPLHTVIVHAAYPETTERGAAGRHELERRRIEPMANAAKESAKAAKWAAWAALASAIVAILALIFK